MRGVVTSGGARDTDEIIKEKIPLYMKRHGRGVPPGRNEIESIQKPIMCGGVLVRPGDVIVAKAAREVLVQDKVNRRKMSEKLGIPLDRTVMPD